MPKGSNGFTLVEILVAVAIIGIVAAVSVPNINKFNNDQQLDNTKTDLIRLLKQAQSSSMNRIKCPNLQAPQVLDTSTGQILDDTSNQIVWELSVSNTSKTYTLRCGYSTNPSVSFSPSVDVISFNIPSGVTMSVPSVFPSCAGTTAARFRFVSNNVMFYCGAGNLICDKTSDPPPPYCGATSSTPYQLTITFGGSVRTITVYNGGTIY